MTFYLEITREEQIEIDNIIERWSGEDSIESPTDRLVAAGLLPILLQLKSVCKVPEEAPEVPAIPVTPWPLDPSNPSAPGHVPDWPFSDVTDPGAGNRKVVNGEFGLGAYIDMTQEIADDVQNPENSLEGQVAFALSEAHNTSVRHEVHITNTVEGIWDPLKPLPPNIHGVETHGRI